MKRFFSLLLLISFCFLLSAEQMQMDLTFSEKDFSLIKGQYDRIISNYASYKFEAGSPDLPVITKTYILPAGYSADSIIYEYSNEHLFAGNVNMMPVQKKVPLSDIANTQFTPQDREIYNNLFPQENVFLGHQGLLYGNSICNIHVCPFRYTPASGELNITEHITIKIFISPRKSLSSVYMPLNIAQPILTDMVDNPQSVSKYINLSNSIRSTDSTDYYIITDADYDTIFARLAQWKTKKGIRTMTVTTDYIYSNYSGVDNAEQIRNFIIDMNSSEGAIYFLLAGQADYENSQEIVPRRNVYYLTCGAGYYSDEDTLISDLYYADLDGSWNADGDNTWGETADNVDMYGDVFVGRAPVRTVAQAQTFVNKVLTYEKNPDTSYINTMILPAAILWSYYEGDTIYQNRIAEMPYADWTVTKMYERKSELTHNGFIQAMNDGVMLGHWVGHGNEGGIYTYYADAFFNNTDADTVSNMPAIGIVNSIGCMCGAMDYISGGDCFAEKLIINDNGGSVAAMMNSRFGWGNPPSIGPSEEIDTLFYHHFFYDSIYNLGMAHTYSKNGLVSRISWTDVWAWCIYELNLFGDPELDIYTGVPGPLHVVHPTIASMGSNDLDFTITDSSSGDPVANARICVMNDSSYIVGTTNSSGYILLSGDIISDDSLDITVTAHNHLPYETKIPVSSENPGRPVLLSMPECIRINTLTPSIEIASIDDENDDIIYRAYWDDDITFKYPDSITSALSGSGDTVSIMLAGIMNNTVYYYRAKANDPGGSGYWSPFSVIHSFIADTSMGNDNCSFYQCNDYQFSLNTMNGALISNNTITLSPDTNILYDTLMFEDFESGSITNGWTVDDINNDANTWDIISGQPSDLGGTPPNCESYYVYYSDDDAGSGNVDAVEYLNSPVVYTNSYDNLQLVFSYAFRNYLGEYLYVEISAFNGSWNTDTLATITATAYTDMTVDISSLLPADSIKVSFIYDDNGHWAWAAGIDNVMIRSENYYSQSFGQFFTKAFLFEDLNSIYPRTSWGYFSWLEAAASDSALMRVQYCDGGSWDYIPEGDLPGNTAGFSTTTRAGSVDLSSLNTAIYDSLRIEGNLYCDSTDLVNIPAITDMELGNLTNVLTGIKSITYPSNIIKSQYILKLTGNMPGSSMPIIQYALPVSSNVNISVFDISGRKITELYNGIQTAGNYTINNKHAVDHSGIYFIYMRTDDFVKSERFLIVK